ncbi:nicotinamide-nucleotide amidase [Pacificibacter maritimus]|uniref:Nicotinamide-nucleotide amidase n=1 Tax=Pacificibacter maritimus TaxID=762213 RepID=A0A3N4UUY2_9RHOB|nr:CinA family protein [Pacificibacter maritimus]RPE71391.1 nicotinamide-nucleotide amidase [Pacificibacter maritimus]
MTAQRAKQVLSAARAQGLRIATAESCTGGGIIAALTDIAGSSDVVDRGFITYSNAAKIDMLGVSAQTLEATGAVSEQVAGEMARGAVQHSQAHLCVSVTGIAGPGGSEFKPVGRVCFGLAKISASGEIEVSVKTVEFGAIGRSEVRAKTVDTALSWLLDALEGDKIATR